MPQWGTSRAHYPAPGCSLVTQTHLPAQLTDGQHHGFHQHDQTASRVPPLALAHPPLPRSPHPGPQRGACQEKRDPGSFHTQAWSSRRKKKTLLSTSSSITNSFDFIMWRWETKPDIWLNWEKKKKGKKKSAFCEGYTFEWLIQQARKSWLLVEQSSCQPLIWTGKAIQVQQRWMDAGAQRGAGIGWVERPFPADAPATRGTPGNCRTPGKRPCW